LSIIDEDLKPDDTLMNYATYRTLESGKTENASNKIAELEKSGFQHWCPFGSNDFAVEHMRSRFLDQAGLAEWPFR